MDRSIDLAVQRIRLFIILQNNSRGHVDGLDWISLTSLTSRLLVCRFENGIVGSPHQTSSAHNSCKLNSKYNIFYLVYYTVENSKNLLSGVANKPIFP